MRPSRQGPRCPRGDQDTRPPAPDGGQGVGRPHRHDPCRFRARRRGYACGQARDAATSGYAATDSRATAWLSRRATPRSNLRRPVSRWRRALDRRPAPRLDIHHGSAAGWSARWGIVPEVACGHCGRPNRHHASGRVAPHSATARSPLGAARVRLRTRLVDARVVCAVPGPTSLRLAGPRHVTRLSPQPHGRSAENTGRGPMPAAKTASPRPPGSSLDGPPGRKNRFLPDGARWTVTRANGGGPRTGCKRRHRDQPAFGGPQRETRSQPPFRQHAERVLYPTPWHVAPAFRSTASPRRAGAVGSRCLPAARPPRSPAGRRPAGRERTCHPQRGCDAVSSRPFRRPSASETPANDHRTARRHP